MSDETIKNDKRHSLLNAFSLIEKQFGKGSIMTLDADRLLNNIEIISTGSLSLDLALGIGGFPKGRIIEIFGPESCGKTTIAIKALASCQKVGGTVAFIDAEHALDATYVNLIGGNVNDLIISQPSCGEEALEIVDILAKSKAVDMIIVDSVAALTPKNEIDGEMGAMHIGTQARLMSQALRKLTAHIQKTNTILIFINQLRMKIGVMFGNPEVTPGGNALKFYASIRIDLRRGNVIKNAAEELIGHTVKAKIIKNKMAAPFRIAEFDLLYHGPTPIESEVISVGLTKGLIKLSGSWFKYKDTSLGQGKEKAVLFLKDNPTILEQLLLEIQLPKI